MPCISCVQSNVCHLCWNQKSKFCIFMHLALVCFCKTLRNTIKLKNSEYVLTYKYNEYEYIQYLRILKNKLKAQHTVAPVPKNDDLAERIL